MYVYCYYNYGYFAKLSSVVIMYFNDGSLRLLVYSLLGCISLARVWRFRARRKRRAARTLLSCIAGKYRVSLFRVFVARVCLCTLCSCLELFTDHVHCQARC